MTALAQPIAAEGVPVRLHAFVARHYPLLLGLLCLAAALAYGWGAREAIALRSFPDPDDEMRLQQVRDLLAGQSWFDVTQFRMNPPFGAPMHWSRLIDMPIAGTILMLRPLIGPTAAEVAALVIVPCCTLAASMAAAAGLTRRLISREAGLAAAAIAPITVSALQQMQPLRIDHHGWQVCLTLLIARALLVRDGARAGLIAGALGALWLAISLEGLPFVAAAGALVGLLWLRDPGAGAARFETFALALGVTGFGLFALTRAGAAWVVPACDAMSPVHLGVFAVVAAGVPLVVRLGAGHVARRLAALALLGAACGIAYAGIGPRCVSGAFVALDPLVKHNWYDRVLEGLPLWKQSWVVAVTAIGYPIVGLAGALLALRRATGEARGDWAVYAFLLGAAALATVFVQRSGAMANMLALPGGVVLMAGAFARIQRLAGAVPRVLGSTLAMIALMPTMPGLAAAMVADAAAPAVAAHPPVKSDCATIADFATAARLPRSILFTNIDIGPGILVATPHSVIASGHHRNAQGLHDVLAAFLGTEAEAHAIIRRRHAAYVVVCAETTEMSVYRRVAPAGFWGGLAKGRTPAWLTRAPIPGSQLSVWKVTG